MPVGLDALHGLSWQLLGGAAAAMLFVVAIAAGIRSLVGRRDAVVERIERIERSATSANLIEIGAGGAAGDTSTLALARVLRPLSLLARPGKSDELARLRTNLGRAGYRGEHAIEIFLGVKLGATPILTALFLIINSSLASPMAFPMDAGIALVLAAVAFFLPNLWLRSRVKERQTAIERALPDAMDLIVTCVEAGLGLDATIARVAEEMILAAPLLGEELRQTFLEIQAGVSRGDAFRRLADRTGVEDLRALSAMLIQTDLFGTSIARALRVHSEGMRVRRAQRAEEKAAMVSVKMTIPLILCILPSLLAIVMGPAVAMIVRNFAGQGQ